MVAAAEKSGAVNMIGLIILEHLQANLSANLFQREKLVISLGFVENILKIFIPILIFLLLGVQRVLKMVPWGI